MVNTVPHIDGQTIIAIEGQETQEADEPPICGLKSPENHQINIERSTTTSTTSPPPTERNGSFLSPNDNSIKRDGLARDTPTAGSSFVDGKSSDGNTLNNSIGSWDGSPGLAHLIDAPDVAAQLEVDPKHGLTSEQAKQRLERDGPNQIDGAGTVSIGQILLRQISNSLTIVLAIAMALSYGTMDFIEGAVISAVIVLNIVLGFVQDFRAEKTMKSLLSLAAPTSQVVRNNGKVEVVKAETLVVGDVVRLTTGVVVPADLRIIESSNLEIEEALLTGESLPAVKHVEAIGLGPDGETALGDRTNMAYSATTVTKGRATGIVVATGMKTQVGNVAELLRGQSNIEESKNPAVRVIKRTGRAVKKILGLVGTPMQVKLSKFALFLFALAILLAIIVFSAAKWRLHNEVVLYGICVAVAVIPESLIAVMTITVAVGVKAMAAGNVVIRKMAALEAIGGVTNICSDKTGTLTQGKMIVHKVWIPAMGTLSISDAANILDPEDGTLSLDGKPIDKFDVASQDTVDHLRPVLDAVALNNVAQVERDEPAYGTTNEKLPAGEWKALGDPTEIALQVLAMRFGRGKPNILAAGNLEQVMEHQFDSSLKRMSTVYKHTDGDYLSVYTKGASEAILPTVNISEKELDALYPVLDELASEGLRVLCIASKTISSAEEGRVEDRAFIESELTLHGLVGLYDPPRIETLGAVQKCHGAGIAVHMLTGDHLATASAIARKVGILKEGAEIDQLVMKAQDFDKLSDAEIDALPTLPVVLARCSPTTKVRMVDALDRRRAFCVMTGDGVNDAPALKRAHVGIAMGINGTDVAKDAADMVLTDDNFASIVKAVEEGRRLFDNIQKFLMHLLISNISQVVLLLIALAFKDRDGNSVFPLSPLEILWVNMVTSSFLALGLGMEEAQTDIMVRPPRDLRVGVFTWELICDKMLYGVWAGILCLLSFIIVTGGGNTANLGADCNEAWNGSCDVVFRARATVFAVLSFILLVTAWEVKHFTRSLFNLDPTRFSGPFAVFKACVYNRFLLWAVVAGFVITFPVIYIPVVNTTVFKHKGIGREWGIVVAAFVLYVAFIECWKACKRRWGIFASPPVRMIGEANV